MSMPPDDAVRLGYFRLRVRTHEWAERQRISLLDVNGIGRFTLRLLYNHDLTTASRIMETPTEEIMARLRGCANFPKDESDGRRMIQGWKVQIRTLWDARVGESAPSSWRAEP